VASTAPDRGDSHTLAILFMVAIVMILIVLVWLLFQMPFFDVGSLVTPAFLQILQVLHTDGNNLNYDSRVILVHNGTDSLDNDNLRAEFYRNGTKISAVIETMNGYRFISTRHFGVQTLDGSGSRGRTWEPREKISIDFSDRTFHPGDRIRVDIFSKSSGELISSHTYIAYLFHSLPGKVISMNAGSSGGEHTSQHTV